MKIMASVAILCVVGILAINVFAFWWLFHD